MTEPTLSDNTRQIMTSGTDRKKAARMLTDAQLVETITTQDYPTPVEAINSAMGMDTDEAYHYFKAWQHGEDLSEFDTPIEDDDHER